MTDLHTIKTSEEISRILREAEVSHAEVSCELADLEIRSVSGSNLVLGLKRLSTEGGGMLASVFPPDFTIGTEIEIILSLVHGQYALRETVHDISLTTFTVNVSSLLRLQRRKDFRVSVRNEGYRFFWAALPETEGFLVVDLSVGGLRLLWPPSAGAVPRTKTVLRGRLEIEKSLALEMVCVKNHGPDSPSRPELGVALSFEFRGLNQETSQALLFTGLAVHRKYYGTR